MKTLHSDHTGPELSFELWDALGRPAALPPGRFWEEGSGTSGSAWHLKILSQPPPLAAGSPRRAFSSSELTRLLPGKLETPERTYYGILIWGAGVYELKYESMSIKGFRPEPYRHLWKFISPSPLQQPSEVLCKARMLLHLLKEGYLTPEAALRGLGGPCP